MPAFFTPGEVDHNSDECCKRLGLGCSSLFDRAEM